MNTDEPKMTKEQAASMLGISLEEFNYYQASCRKNQRIKSAIDDLVNAGRDAIRTMQTYGTANMGFSIDRVKNAIDNYEKEQS